MDPVEFPNYLLSGQIKQLIGLTGLDVNNSEVHKNILSAFQSQTNELPIFYTLWKPENESPKSEKQIFRSPKGIIKRDWPLKYLLHRPSVVVLFVDLNWDHPNWLEKRVEVESKVASLRQGVPVKETKIALVLIQNSNSSSLSPDDYLAKDRSKELWESCQLSEKQLFVFPDYEPYNAVVRRMENALYELGQSFYQGILRRIRGRSIPNNYPNLTIRQQFKLGFLSEMRQDTHSALRPYRQAYQHCSEAEIPDTELFEYLSIVSVLNYKICELSFIHNLPGEAVTQFSKLNASFFNRRAGYYPSPELAEIELAKWKSQQCRLFADLFSHAITKGLAAFPHQNPGLQLDMSADFLCHANARIILLKASVGQQELASMHKDILEYPADSPYPIYLGQRPWRARSHLNSQLDPLTEHAAKQALEIVCQPNHQQSLTLFSAAMRNFQIFRLNRMQRTVLLKMADEYFNLRRFQKSMQVLVHVIYELRRESVNQILFPILQRCLDASYCDVDVKDYVWTVSQLLNPSIIFSTINQPYYLQLKAQLEENFNNLLQGIPPKTHSSLYTRLSQVEIGQVEQKWKELYTTEFEFTTNLTRLDPHLQAVAVFLPKDGGKSINSGESAILQVSVRNSSSASYRFTSLQAQIEEHGLTRSTSPPILPSLTLKTENIQIPPNTRSDLFFDATIGEHGPAREKAFQVTHIRLEFSTSNWRIKGFLEFENNLQTLVPASARPLLRSVFCGDIGTHVLRVLPTKPKLELVWPESDVIYTDAENKLRFVLKNNENTALKNVKIMCRQLDTEEEQPEGFVFPSVLFNEHGQQQPRLTKDVAPYISPGTEIDFTLNCFVKCPFESQVQVRIQATTKDPRYSEGLIESAFSLKFVGKRPFAHTTLLYAPNDDHIEFLIQGHDTRVECVCRPHMDVEITNARFVLPEDLSVDNKKLAVPDGIQKAKSIVKFGTTLKAPTELPITSDIDIGKLVLKWKRPGADKITESWLPLGRIHIQQCPLKIEPIICGTSHIMRKLIEMEYKLSNLTDKALHFKVNVERADSLMFSGYTERQIFLAPKSNESLKIAVIALGAGQLQIPKLQISSKGTEFDELVQKYALGYLKSTIFVTVS
ncbi:unnamed protein product [Bursaphelenchus xylophilus]|uniref:(pine wood nematode) hypothetical protein n=1 Tax=Bursaphelenchus xylophilus TaxID=6326 RepID=A0A1I7SPW0_BURXY|nr:unnamed protein product [Bursaphelenchus xylophilus]CAG9109283.1 unnamed protein product [Bursaphelenchus xylophilus]